MSNLRRYWSTTVFAAWAGLLSIALAVAGEPDRSPVDLAISADETLMVVANQTVGTLSLVDLEQGKVIDETPCGKHTAAVALSPDETLVLATAQYSGDLCFFELTGRRLRPAGRGVRQNCARRPKRMLRPGNRMSSLLKATALRPRTSFRFRPVTFASSRMPSTGSKR